MVIQVLNSKLGITLRVSVTYSFGTDTGLYSTDTGSVQIHTVSVSVQILVLCMI